MKKRKETKNLPINYIRSNVSPESLDEEKRTLDITWTTGHKGLRSIFGFRYYEELSLDKGAVDMSRLKNGAPVLAVHDQFSLDAVIGVVERASIKDGEGIATIRFSSDPDADKIFNKIKEGVLRSISVGYSVEEYDEIEQDDEIPLFRAVRWTPKELSIVPIGFDPHAQVRNQENLESTVIINRSIKEKGDMKGKGKEGTAPEEVTRNGLDPEAITKKASEVAKSEADKAAKEAVKLERQRCSEILEAVRAAGLDESDVEEFIREDISADEARRCIFKRMSEKRKVDQPSVSTAVRVEVGTEDVEKKRSAISNALLHRLDGSFELEQGNEFRGMTLLRAMESVVQRRPGEYKVEFVTRVLSSSDLPLILANTANKRLQKAYELQPRTWSRWTPEPGRLSDLKTSSILKMSDFASLSEIKEGGEYTFGTVSEGQEQVSLAKYGKKYKFTDVMLINDDLSALARLSSQPSVAVSRLENQLVYTQLTSNPTMGEDSKALFHADHSNTIAQAAPGETPFSTVHKQMRQQTVLGGTDTINAFPKFIISGPEQEIAIRKFLQIITPTQSSNVNVFSNAYEQITDAQISDDAYYFAADPALIPTIRLYRLEGRETPTVQTRENWDNDCIELKVNHFAAAKAEDFRGLQRVEKT